ncbi:S1 RNA-binding domain-containing protein [Streptomyces sp. NPDC087538]|uniref:S1 RNA-binding domain-containing protein n=1 Tax=Streptomyces sp. NPDC087538 TaxID=3365797 RepID=UPI0038113718
MAAPVSAAALASHARRNTAIRAREAVLLINEQLNQEVRVENWSMSQSIKEGDICRGVVSDVADFGAFIDLGSCAGFVNVTEITWASFARVSEVMQRGQEVIAVLIGADPAREQLLLSIKGLQEDPIRKFAREEFGKIIAGSVTELTPIGIFVSLMDGLVGLLPQSTLVSDGEKFRVGDEIFVEVIGINLDSRQITLTLSR